MGKSTTYKKLVKHIETCAKALKTIGIREGYKVTIAMPNCPDALAQPIKAGYMLTEGRKIAKIADDALDPLRPKAFVPLEASVSNFSNGLKKGRYLTVPTFFYRCDRI